MKHKIYFKSIAVVFLSLLIPVTGITQNISKIAFGSCGSEDHPLPIFDVVVKHDPDLFIFLGDNIYGDTENMDTLKKKYDSLSAKPTFQNLKKNVDIIATWDDHDYGLNDMGKRYPFKQESKEIFLNFFNEPTNSPRREHKGVYTSYIYEMNGKKLQVILLDTRTFRDDLKLYKAVLEKEEKSVLNKHNPGSAFLRVC